MDSLDEKLKPQADVGSAWAGVVAAVNAVGHRAEARSRQVRLYLSVFLDIGWWCVEAVSVELSKNCH